MDDYEDEYILEAAADADALSLLEIASVPCMCKSKENAFLLKLKYNNHQIYSCIGKLGPGRPCDLPTCRIWSNERLHNAPNYNLMNPRVAEERKQAAADALYLYSQFVMTCIGEGVRPSKLRLHLMKEVSGIPSCLKKDPPQSTSQIKAGEPSSSGRMEGDKTDSLSSNAL